jgi:nucleoside-diphosphate-sugar epimerase
MKRVLVTGATGFIGAAVARLLVDQGYDVAALVRPSSDGWRLGDYSARIRFICGRIDEPDSYRAAIKAFAADTVMHLAWQGVAKLHRNDPSQVHVNVCGSADFFYAACDAGCETFIGAGSQAEYGPMTSQVDEASPTRPSTLYGAAKLATYVLLSQMAASRDVRFAWLRIFSVYGPHDDEGTLISSLIRDFLAGRRPAVTTADQLWDFLYVDDAALAFLAVAKSSAAGVFNIGSGNAPPLCDTITRIRDSIDPRLSVGFGEVQLPDGVVGSLQPRIDRIRALAAWDARTSFADGISTTISAHIANSTAVRGSCHAG